MRIDVTAEKVFPSGYWSCSAMVNGYLFRRVFGGYTKRQAVKLFRAAARAQ